MKFVFVLLIVVLIIVILYGYSNFSYNINNFLKIKEGFDEVKEFYNVSNETSFLEFLRRIYNNFYDISDTTTSGNSLIQKNITSIIKIMTSYNKIFATLDYDKLINIGYNADTDSYTNIVKNEYDKKYMNELILSIKAFDNLQLNEYLSTKNLINESDFNNLLYNSPCLYNSLLGYLNKYTNCIVYFSKKNDTANIINPTVEGDNESTMSYIYEYMYPNSLVLYYPFYKDTYDYSIGFADSIHHVIDNYGCTIYEINNKDDNNGLKLNGNSYVTLPTIFITNKGFTVTCWFKLSSTSTNIMDKENIRLFDFGNNNKDTIAYKPTSGLLINTTTKSNHMVNDENSANYLDNIWHHFALTIQYVSSTSSNYKVFIDGNVEIKTSNTSILPYPKLGDRTTNYIGKSNYGDNVYPTGYIRDFRIYNRTLNDKEILKIKNLYKDLSLYTDPNTGYLNIGI
jgi:hypothetical protein